MRVVADLMHKETSASSSIVVHCHAGLGRTGVAVALDICLARIRHRATVDVHDTIVSAQKGCDHIITRSVASARNAPIRSSTAGSTCSCTRWWPTAPSR